MPFFDDTGVETGEHSPLWSVFTVIRDQLERLIVLNIVWAIQWIPLLVGIGWQELPAEVRIILIMYSPLVYGPSTAVLYGMVRLAAQGEPLFAHQAVDLFKATWLKSTQAFMPLIGLLGGLLLLTYVPDVTVSAIGQLLLMLALVCSNYWCVLIAAKGYSDPLQLMAESVRIVWRYPAESVVLSVAVLLAIILGTISIGGWVLIIPVVIALLQTQMYRSLMEK